MTNATNLDLLAYNASTVVQERMRLVDTERTDAQTFSGWYVRGILQHQKVAVPALADACGLSRTFIYGVLSGTKKLSTEAAMSLATHADFTVPELITVLAVDQFEAMQYAG